MSISPYNHSHGAEATSLGIFSSPAGFYPTISERSIQTTMLLDQVVAEVGRARLVASICMAGLLLYVVNTVINRQTAPGRQSR